MDQLESPLLEDEANPNIQEENKVDQRIDEKHAFIKIPSRKIIIEPILVMHALVTYPLSLTISLFVYHRFLVDAAANYGLNTTDVNNTELCVVNTSSIEYKVTNEAQEKTSLFNIYTGIAGAIPCLFTTIFLGPYSDKAGRKYAIVTPVIGDFLFAMICMLVIIFHLPVWYLILAYFIDGMGGKYTMMLAGCFSYIADITEPESRQFRITVVECIAFMPIIAGPIAVGYMIEKTGYLWPIVIAAAVYVFVILYVLFFVPETVKKQGTKAVFWTLDHIKAVAKLFIKETTPKRRCNLIWLYLAFMPVIMVALGDQITTLFLQNLPFCWDSVKLGYYSSGYIAVLTIGGIVSAKLLKICLYDHMIALLSAASSVIRNTYHALVKTDLMVYFIPVFSIFSLLYIPTLRAMMSKLVGPTEQGTLFSSIAICEVIFGFVGNFVFTSIYAETLSFMRGFAYLMMALFYLLGFFILLGYVIRLSKRKYVTIDEETQ